MNKRNTMKLLFILTLLLSSNVSAVTWSWDAVTQCTDNTECPAKYYNLYLNGKPARRITAPSTSYLSTNPPIGIYNGCVSAVALIDGIEKESECTEFPEYEVKAEEVEEATTKAPKNAVVS